MVKNSSNNMWAEPLPISCPPLDAYEPNSDIFYRLTSAYPPIDRDFFSQRKLYPEKSFNDECRASALSVQDTLVASQNLQKLPTQKNNKYIVELVLTVDSGLVKKTGKDANHYSWWQAKSFNPIKNCTLA